MDTNIIESVERGSRIRVRKFEAELMSEAGASLPKTDDTFTGTVLGVYGNHPTTPTLIEVKVKRDDNGCEIYCNSNTIVEVLPEIDSAIPSPIDKDLWFSRKVRELVDEIVGTSEIEIDVNDLTFITGVPDEIEIDV